MKSLETRYKKITNNNENLGPYICLVRAVKNQRFSRKTISFWFSKLVPKDDYDIQTRKSLLNNLWVLTNSAEEGVKRFKNDL